MDEDFITSTISVYIPDFSERYVEGKTVTFYCLNVIYNLYSYSFFYQNLFIFYFCLLFLNALNIFFYFSI